MKKASLTETKNRLGALIDEVREGETILVLDRGCPVARIEPVVGDAGDAPGRLERLERKGQLRRPRKSGRSDVLKSLPPQAKSKVSILDALLAERESGK